MIIDLVRKNRSCRGYNHARKVSEEELRSFADCARLTASSINIQPLKYYLAWEEEEVARIQSLTSWAGALPQMKLPHPGMEPTGFIVICQDTGIFSSVQRFQKDVGIAAQTILLAAVEAGLGGCMIGNFSQEKVHTELGLPENIVPLLIVAIGEPAEEIVLTDVGEDGNTNYYRDENDVHYVPKRSLEDVILTAETYH